jgi:predicted DNA-binding transcriptional regulator YafY
MSSLALAFTDDEIEVVLAAARPLAPSDRDAFLQAVAVELRNAGGELGVHRVRRELQRQFFAPPDLSRGNDTSRWRR